MRRLKVVIVEDSASIRSRLVALVEEIGNLQVVGEATTEVAAINMCIGKQPDVIILDMQLETGSGLGVLKALKLNSGNSANSVNSLSAANDSDAPKSTPRVIVLTNFPSPSVQRAAITLGAEHFLDKSLEFHKLPALLKTAAGD